jgi:hypothetical protein
MMHGLLAYACRAFPRDYRARQSGELVDTALLAAGGSPWRAIREALSLVVAGMRQRLRAESGRSLRDGVVVLVVVLAVVNLAVALAGIAACVHPPPPAYVILGIPFFRNPYVIDWWWVAFAVAAAGIVLGLLRGNRRLAFGAALANASLVAYDAFFLAEHGRGHFAVFTYLQTAGFPSGWLWLPAAVLLALATAAAQPHRVPVTRLHLVLAPAVLLVVLSRLTWGFFFLRWPLAATVVLAMALGWLVPRLAVLAVGLTLVVVPIVVAYLTTPYYHAPVVTWVVAPGLALGVLMPLAHLTRRRLT